MPPSKQLSITLLIGKNRYRYRLPFCVDTEAMGDRIINAIAEFVGWTTLERRVGRKEIRYVLRVQRHLGVLRAKPITCDVWLSSMAEPRPVLIAVKPLFSNCEFTPLGASLLRLFGAKRLFFSTPPATSFFDSRTRRQISLTGRKANGRRKAVLICLDYSPVTKS